MYNQNFPGSTADSLSSLLAALSSTPNLPGTASSTTDFASSFGAPVSNSLLTQVRESYAAQSSQNGFQSYGTQDITAPLGNASLQPQLYGQNPSGSSQPTAASIISTLSSLLKSQQPAAPQNEHNPYPLPRGGPQMYGNGHHISNVSPLLQMWTERPVDGFGQGSNAPQLNPNGYQSTHMPSDPRRPAPSDPRSQQYRSWPPVSERQAPPAVAQHATLNSSQYTQKSQSNIEDEDDVPPLPPVSDTMANSASAPNIPSVNSKSERPGKGGISPADLHTLAELSEDGRILKTVHELQEEQVRKENELLAKRTAIIEKHENDLLALEITGTLSPQQKRENKQLLAEELRIYDKMILKEMDFVRKNQQVVLQEAGVPLFNVTNDPRAIIRQQNVLSLLTSMMPT